MKFKHLLIFPLLVATLQAASVADLTFTLNSDSTEYSVSDCDESASGSLDIPSTYNGLHVTLIGSSALYYCTSLTSITIPDGVTSIGDNAFDACTSLNSITISDSVSSIGSRAFRDCTSLTSITIPDSVTSIGDFAFRDCTSLNSITIGDSLTSIGVALFGVTNISYDYTADNLNYLISRSGQSAYLVDGLSASGSVNIPAQVNNVYVKLISDGAFSGNPSLISITIPDSVTSIGKYSFYGSSNLTSITIPDSVTSIGPEAFGKTQANISFYRPLLEAAEAARDALPTQAAYDAVVDERNAKLTLDEVKDLRAGSTMIAVENGQATLSMEVEESDDLGIWTVGGTVSIQMNVQPSEDKKFFRFKMAE